MGCASGREFRWRREGMSWGIIKMRKFEREKKKVSERKRKKKKKKKMMKVCDEIKKRKKKKKKVKYKRNIILVKIS